MVTLGDVISAQQMGELRMENIERPNRRPLVLFGGESLRLSVLTCALKRILRNITKLVSGSNKVGATVRKHSVTA